MEALFISPPYPTGCGDTRRQGDEQKVKPKSAVVRKAKKEGKNNLFGELFLGLCHLKNVELAKHLQFFNKLFRFGIPAMNTCTLTPCERLLT